MPEVLVNVDTVLEWAKLFFEPLRTHHTYTNFDIDLIGDSRAHAFVYMTARHWKTTELGGSTNTQYGWYEFSLARAADGWKIDRIKHDFAWIAGNGGLIDFHEPEFQRAAAAVFSEQNVAAAKSSRR